MYHNLRALPFAVSASATRPACGMKPWHEPRMLSPPLDETPETVRALLEPLRGDFSVAVECAGNAFAVGAIIRVAHNFLAREVILIGSEPHYEKASMGMEKYERVVRVASAADFRVRFMDRPIVAFERERARRSVYDVERFPAACILLFGSERFGTSNELLEVASDVLAIPQFGVNNSLPVAIAAGIAMSEWSRRHRVGLR
jgi:tRNA G18 (ribose-2'-O)-methylase SpoU